MCFRGSGDPGQGREVGAQALYLPWGAARPSRVVSQWNLRPLPGWGTGVLREADRKFSQLCCPAAGGGETGLRLVPHPVCAARRPHWPVTLDPVGLGLSQVQPQCCHGL